MLRGKKENRAGKTLSIGSKAIDCALVNKNFEVIHLNQFFDKPMCIYTFPTIEIKKNRDNLKRLNIMAEKNCNIHFICVSLDIPFTLNRVITSYKLEHIRCLSDFRTREFGFAYGTLILDGLLAGMLADSFLLLSKDNTVNYIQHLEYLERDLNWQDIESALQY